MFTTDELFDKWIESKSDLTFDEWMHERETKKDDLRDILNYIERRTGVYEISLGELYQ